MIGRILRIELRRSAALGVAVLLLVTALATALPYTHFFAGRWMQLAIMNRSALMVLVPLALAGGAWIGRRDARHRVDELFASTVLPRWQRVLPTAGALAIAVVTAYLLVFLVGIGWVAPTAGHFPIAALVVTAVGALSLVAAGWFGMAAGRAVPRIITGPVLAVLAFALVALVPDFLFLTFDPETGQRNLEPPAALLNPVFNELDDFQTITTSTSLLQAFWLVALSATALLLLGAVRRRAIALAVLPAVLAAAVAVPLLPTGGVRGAATVDPVAIELVCDNDGPEVCVRRTHAALLPDVVGPAREALSRMAAKLPNAPTRAVENHQVVFWAQLDPNPAPIRHQADTVVFDAPSINRDGGADLSGDYFLPALFEAAWRQDCGEESDNWAESQVVSRDDLYVARKVAAAWLTDAPPIPGDWLAPAEAERMMSAYQTLVDLPQDEQRRQMSAARDAMLDCRYDALLAILPQENP